jgi:hypothetical protein
MTGVLAPESATPDDPSPDITSELAQTTMMIRFPGIGTVSVLGQVDRQTNQSLRCRPNGTLVIRR